MSEAVEAVDEGKYNKMLQELMGMSIEDLKILYQEREIEPEIAGEDWQPAEKNYL